MEKDGNLILTGWGYAEYVASAAVALKALDGGPAPSKCPESVIISPSDPLADIDQFPRLRDFHPAGTWVFWPEYKDEFTSDRLRWQLWTWRRE